MTKFAESMVQFKDALQQGWVITAYRGLMEFMMDLRTHFSKKYPDHFISGSLYQGYMDMSYFAIVPEPLIQRKLKIAILFNYQDFRFDVFLIGVNKKVQAKYIQMIKKAGWKNYEMAPAVKGYDHIIEHTLVESPDFSDLTKLRDVIELGVCQFTREVEEFLETHDQ